MRIALPGEGPDFQRVLRPDQAHDEIQQRALIRRDLHRRIRHQRRLRPHPIENPVIPRARPAEMRQQLLSRFEPPRAKPSSYGVPMEAPLRA
jgi:hypothetical protein